MLVVTFLTKQKTFVMQAAFLFTVVGTTGFLGVLAGQLPGVSITHLCFALYVCLMMSYKDIATIVKD